MRIIWLCHYSPYPLIFGAAVRTYHLLKRLASEHDVTLAYLAHEDEPIHEHLVEILDDVKRFKPTHSRGKARVHALAKRTCLYRQEHYSAELNKWLKQNADTFDMALIDSTHMSWYDLPEDMPRVIDLHNIESELLRRTAETDSNKMRGIYRKHDAKKLHREEMDSLKKADHLWVPSQREVEYLHNQGVNAPMSVVHNGVDLEFFTPAPADEVPDAETVYDIVFIGITNFYPNEQGILWFTENAWPKILAQKPDAKLAVIGGAPPPSVLALDDDNVDVLGYVPEILPYYRGAKLTIVPLFSGGGTRLKILEAASAGAPIVTTTLGAEGIPMKDRVHGRITDDPTEFAEACLETMAGGEFIDARKKAAMKLAHDIYGWQPIGDVAMQAISEIDERLNGKPEKKEAEEAVIAS